MNTYISSMLARCLLLVVTVLVACVPSAFGQLPKRLEKCLPYPTLAQEIRDRQPAPTRVRVHVIRVGIDPNDGIPADAQEEISAELRSHVFEPDAALQTEGADISVVVTLSATPGLQYRAGDIRTESTDGNPLAISPEILRSFIPLHRGELFSVALVRTGLENLGRAYGREGYVDMTPEPDTAVDNDRQTIDLVIKIDQQVQYRVGSIDFLGINAATREKLMESLPKPGEILDMTKLEEFFKVNRTILPPDASRDDVAVERDNKQRTVGVLFDLRVCPQQSN